MKTSVDRAGIVKTNIRQAKNLACEAMLETLWPTRCAICDKSGMLVCIECQNSLPFLDRWQACPLCGSPRGAMQCCSCNPVKLEAAGLEELPFDGCVSAVELDKRTGRIVTLFKDGGEQRLARSMAAFLAPSIPPAWLVERPYVSFVPASENAFRRRGFDHAELLARETSRMLSLPGGALFLRPRSRDQRRLSKSGRMENMANRLKINARRDVPNTVLIVDDVFTTGATLFSASAACKQAGVHRVYCATFARAEVVL